MDNNNMLDKTCLELIKSIIDTQKNLVVVFRNEVPVMTNKSFNSFLGLSSFDDYISDAPPFVEHFAMHPLYFNKDKVKDGESWFKSILDLEQDSRIISMMNTKYEPRAFILNIENSIDDFKLVTFEDITQDLIKRIMIENNSNIDKKSGAYSKAYFLQICQNYEDAAVFNEKIIGLSLITLSSENELDAGIVSEFVTNFKSTIRQDDMLVRWAKDEFIFVYLVDNETNASLVVSKLKEVVEKKLPVSLKYSYKSVFQKNGEKISKMLDFTDL